MSASKAQRRRKHITRLERKMRKMSQRGEDTSGVYMEIEYAKDPERKNEFATGRLADRRVKR